MGFKQGRLAGFFPVSHKVEGITTDRDFVFVLWLLKTRSLLTLEEINKIYPQNQWNVMHLSQKNSWHYFIMRYVTTFQVSEMFCLGFLVSFIDLMLFQSYLQMTMLDEFKGYMTWKLRDIVFLNCHKQNWAQE